MHIFTTQVIDIVLQSELPTKFVLCLLCSATFAVNHQANNQDDVRSSTSNGDANCFSHVVSGFFGFLTSTYVVKKVCLPCTSYGITFASLVVKTGTLRVDKLQKWGNYFFKAIKRNTHDKQCSRMLQQLLKTLCKKRIYLTTE